MNFYKKCGKNAKSLRYLSIVSRCIGEGINLI